MLITLQSSAVFAETQADQPIINNKNLIHYLAHICTGGLSYIACVGIQIVNDLVTGDAAVNSEKYVIKRTFKADETSRTLMVLPCLATQCYILYNTPQWTDTHVLQKDSVRTRKQNIVPFLIRLFIRNPIGVALGEYATD